MKRVGVGALASAIIVALAQPVGAHASLEVKEAQVGAGYKAVVSVPHRHPGRGHRGQADAEARLEAVSGEGRLRAHL